MSSIVGADGRPVRPAKQRGSDFCTKNEAINIAGNMVGPVALVLQEVMQKVARLEDLHGITDETVAAETEPPKGAPLSVLGEQARAELLPSTPQFTPATLEATAGGDVE